MRERDTHRDREDQRERDQEREVEREIEGARARASPAGVPTAVGYQSVPQQPSVIPNHRR